MTGNGNVILLSNDVMADDRARRNMVPIPRNKKRMMRRLLPPFVFCSVVAFCEYSRASYFLPPSLEREIRDEIYGASPPPCTLKQLNIIQQQLPPDACLQNRQTPWKQKCSLTENTNCPDAKWIDDYYKESSIGSKFTGISVGCNKGFDAIEAMRRGSGNPVFDKAKWKQALQEVTGGQVARGVCGQDSGQQFELSEESHIGTREAKMHCIEPLPVTAAALQQASHQLNYDSHGFIVAHAAIAKGSGSAYFPKTSLTNQVHMKVQVGSENQGMATCGRNAARDPRCQEVPTYSLDKYAQQFIASKDDSAIQYLGIDVEGYDYDVLLGGLNETLPRVEYLEFEYNWMGSWKYQSLKDAIQHLENINFTCYWAGTRGRLWRITNCFLDYYEVKHWSNVACVNRYRVPSLHARMEQIFASTLKVG